jgi:hypothetical protein
MTLRAGVVKLVGAALAGSLLVMAAPAAAKPCHPHHGGGGNAEVNQYLETIPGPCGDQPIGGNGSGDQGTSSGSGSSAAGLPPATLTQLESMGPEGAQAAGFAHATNPGGGRAAGGGGAKGSGSPGSAGSGTASDGGGSLLSALENLVTGNDATASNSGQGLGTWLPILFGMVLIGGLGVLALRRGRTG